MARRFSVEAVFRGIDRVSAPVSRIQQRLGRFTRSLEGGLRGVNRLTRSVWGGMRRGFAVAAVAAGALAFSLNGVAAEAGALADQSDRLDFNIEALQEWGFVAEQTGQTAEQFGASLERLARRMGRARSGSGALYGHLRRTDRQLLRQLQTTDDLGEATELIIAAMARAEDPMRRAALASAAFGNSGTKMVNIAKMGADEIAALRREMRENGLVTAQAAADAGEYSNAVNSLRRAWRGFMTGVLLPLTPILTDLAANTRAWLNANRELAAEQVLIWVQDLAANIEHVITQAKRIAIAIGIFAAFTAVLRTLIGVLTVVNLLMAANPVVLVVLGVMALTAALVGLVYYWDTVRDAVVRFVTAVRDHFVGLPAPVKAAIAVLLGPIGLLLAAAAELTAHWGRFKEFFTSIWDGIKAAVADRVEWIVRQVDRLRRIASRVGRLFGLASEDDDELEARARRTAEAEQAAAVSPQERTARSIEERRSTAELTIRDESGRAELNRRGQAPGIDFHMTPTGAF